MDKKELLSPDLAKIMLDLLNSIHTVVQAHPSEPGNLKHDGSPVTSLDIALSTLIENMSKEHFPEAMIYSEENFSDWSFPLMAIDPLDGTKEFILNRPEWALSIGYFKTESFVGKGWVYNPKTKELFSHAQLSQPHINKPQYQGEVSHSEWDKGLYKNVNSDKFSLKPMGSIAYKLGRLSAGKVDFVVSLAPKNIWDIAGGSLLCQDSQIKFFSQGKEVKKVQKLYLPPLIWCREELFAELSALFC